MYLYLACTTHVDDSSMKRGSNHMLSGVSIFKWQTGFVYNSSICHKTGTDQCVLSLTHSQQSHVVPSLLVSVASTILAFAQRCLLFLSSCATTRVIGYQELPFIISFDIGVIIMRLPTQCLPVRRRSWRYFIICRPNEGLRQPRNAFP
jgi:hypothetical protein